MITSQQIQSLEDLHANIALICHNRMKFNGGASDYGIVAKDFEVYVDDIILNAVENAATRLTCTTTTTTDTADTNSNTVADGITTTTATTSSATEAVQKKDPIGIPNGSAAATSTSTTLEHGVVHAKKESEETCLPLTDNHKANTNATVSVITARNNYVDNTSSSLRSIDKY